MAKPKATSSEDADDGRRVMDALRRLVRALRLSSADVERRLGISGAQLFVLVELEGAPRCSIGDIAKRTQTDPSSVSTVVARLVDQGLVARTADPSDARRAILGVTAKGRALVRKAGPPAQTRIVEALATMSSERRRALAGSLDVLVTALGADAGTPTMFFEDERATKRR
jgi:DNA-binding MarR family transcriptional regulator